MKCIAPVFIWPRSDRFEKEIRPKEDWPSWRSAAEGGEHLRGDAGARRNLGREGPQQWPRATAEMFGIGHLRQPRQIARGDGVPRGFGPVVALLDAPPQARVSLRRAEETAAGFVL